MEMCMRGIHFLIPHCVFWIGFLLYGVKINHYFEKIIS